MAGFLDRIRELLGGRIEKAALSQEQAGPTSSFYRNPYPSHPAAGLTPAALAQILRSSIDGNPERYLALAEDMEERFSHYGSVLSTRKRQVASLPLTVEAAGDDPADEAEAALVREVVQTAAFRLAKIDILDAIGKSFSATEIIWDTPSDAPWKPRAFKYRDPRFFEFDRVDPDHILLLAEGRREELKTAGWIVHRAKAKSGLTIRGGLARQVAWLFLFQSFNLKDWAVFCEAYGHPLRVGKFDPGASEADKKILLQAVTNIGSDFAAIIPQAMAIEFIKADITGSTDLFEKRANWIDQQVSKIVLGQTGTTDVIKGGGYASSKVHDDVRDDIKDSDAEQLAATLNEQLVIPLVLFNFAARKRNGFPEIKIGRPEEEDVEALVANVEKLVPLGLEVDMAEMQRKIGVTPPATGAKLLTPRATPQLMTKGKDEPLAPGRQVKAAAAAVRQPQEGDAIDAAVADMLADGGWKPLVTPVVDGLEQEIAAAGSVDEVREILKRRATTMGLAAFTDLLARSAFVACLAGEAEESLS